MIIDFLGIQEADTISFWKVDGDFRMSDLQINSFPILENKPIMSYTYDTFTSNEGPTYNITFDAPNRSGDSFYPWQP